MKKSRKLISLLLSVLLICSLFTVSATAAERLNYVVLGDSIAYGSGLSNPTYACYGKIIADTCDFEYKNYSVPGSTTDALLLVLEGEPVIEAVKEADIISISIGGNDFLMSNIMKLMVDAIVLKDYTEFDKIAESNYANLCEIMSVIRSANPDALVLLQTLYNPQEGYVREPYQYGADCINRGILRYVEETDDNTVVVDVASALGDDMDNYASDAVHPSAKGNELIAKEVLLTLNTLGVTDKTELVINDKGIDFKLSATYGWVYGFFATLLHYISVMWGPVINAFK